MYILTDALLDTQSLSRPYYGTCSQAVEFQYRALRYSMFLGNATYCIARLHFVVLGLGTGNLYLAVLDIL